MSADTGLRSWIVSLTQEEAHSRHCKVASIIANQKLEGLEVDHQTRSDLQELAKGSLTVDQALKRLHARIGHVQI
tara:strand:- start:682 stop:906 length:225 start_codon:yes stop_codon:yes gene_type:complete